MAISLQTSLRTLTGKNPEGQRFLLAVSGGLDSVVLAHSFQESRLNFGIAHCNFQLRAVDADLDEAFVRQLAYQSGAPCFIQRFETLNLALQTGNSVQMEARNLRYMWLEEVRAAQGYDWIVTAHHLDDALETFFINFLRGSGLRGLTGIPERNGNIIRPFLARSRQELEQEYQRKGLSHREDVTNAETTYLRNKIRHLLLPVLQQIEPGILQRAAQNFSALRAALLLFDHSINVIRHTALTQEGHRIYIAWKQLESLPAPATILLELLGTHGFNEAQCSKIWRARTGQPGKIFETASHILLVDRNRFILEPLSEENPAPVLLQDSTTAIPFPGGHLQLLKMQEYSEKPVSDHTDVIQIPASRLAFPLILRKWQAGDRFCPSGMEGKHKKIQDYLTDLHMDRLRKSRVWVLENGDGRIIWLVGLRQDERFRFSSNQTDSCLEIRFFQTEFA